MSLKRVFEGLSRLADFCEKNINTELWPNGPTGEQYLQGLTRRDTEGNPIGSWVDEIFTLGDLNEFMLSLTNWEEFVPASGAARPGCTYIKAQIPAGWTAWCGAIPHLVAEAEGLSVQRRQGLHGEELVAEYAEGVMATNIAVFIIEDGMLSTWHPGPAMAPLGDAVSDETAVKLVDKL